MSIADIFQLFGQFKNQAPQKRYKVTKLQSYKNTIPYIGGSGGEWKNDGRIFNYYNNINKLPN